MTLSAVVMQFTKVFLQTALVLWGTSAVVYAQASGENLYQQCATCHGLQGEGIDALNAPVIAGQDAKYLIRQLINFSSQVRGKAEQSKSMVSIAKSLAKTDIVALATYIQTMEVTDTSPKSTLQGDLKNGSRYYQAKCGACHGGQAQGNKTFNAPRLAQQSSQYLIQQMQDFVTGKRGYDPQDKFGRQMAMMANTTKGTELNDILFYIAKQVMPNKVK